MPETSSTDPLDEALAKVGVRLEKKPDVNPITQMVAQGVGGVAGHVLGGMAGFGTIGKMLSGLAGSIAGHVAVTYDVRLAPGGDSKKPATDAPIDTCPRSAGSSTMGFGDRR